MESVDVPTHIWCVSNPVGGGGKGRQLTEALTILLRRRFPALQVHSGIASNSNTINAPSNEDRPSGVAVCPDDEHTQHHHGAAASSSSPSSPTSASSCNIHYTGGVGDGSRIAKDVLSPRIQSLLDENPQYQQQGMRRHFVVVVGGDGTLSEVIDGLCRGLLEDPQGHMGCCAFSTCSQRREVAQQRLGRLPTIVYLAGGTGADFARLGYCCTTPEDAFSVLTSSRLEALAGMTPNSVEDRANTSNTSGAEGGTGGSGTRPSGASDSSSGKPPSNSSRVRTPTHAKVDIGTVTFLNEIESPIPSSSPSPQFRHQYFINEVSVGLSSAVVQRAEKLKRSCLSYLGGSAVFLGAGAIELLRMTPRPIRVRQVMDLEDPINRHSPSCTHTTATATPSLPQHQQQPCTTAVEQSERWSEGAWVYLATTALVFGNGQYFGGGMKVCPQGNLFDQRLSITSWGESTCGFLFGFPSIYTGRASTSWATSRMFTGQRVVVEVDSSMAPRNAVDAEKIEEFALMEADGEPLSRLPALVETCLGIRFAFLR